MYKKTYSRKAKVVTFLLVAVMFMNVFATGSVHAAFDKQGIKEAIIDETTESEETEVITESETIVQTLPMQRLREAESEEPTEVSTEEEMYSEDFFESNELRDKASRAEGEITFGIRGQEYRHFFAIFVDDQREITASVEGEDTQSIEWSTEDGGIISITEDGDGIVAKGKSLGIATITVVIITNKGRREKDLIMPTMKRASMSGYAKIDADMYNTPDDTYFARTIDKDTVLSIEGEHKSYYRVRYDDSGVSRNGFVLQSEITITADEVNLSHEYFALKIGESKTLTVSVIPDVYKEGVTWKSDKESVAAAGDNGKVTGTSEGTAKVTVVAKGITGDVTGSTMLSVWKEIPKVGAVTVRTVTGRKGATVDSSSAGSLVLGTKVVIIGQCGSYYYVVKNDDSKVFVPKSDLHIPVAAVSLNKREVTIGVGQSYQLSATTKPDMATDKKIRWSSKDSNIAVVAQDGKISGVKRGSSLIEAKSSDGKVVAECKIIVQSKPVYDFPLIEAIEVSSILTDYSSLLLGFEIKAREEKDISYRVTFFNDKGKVDWRTEVEYGETNTPIDYTVPDLDYGKNYSAKITVTYTENGKKKTKESAKINFKIKKPTVTLGLQKVGKSYVNLNLETPRKSFYDYIELRCKEKGQNKYIVLSKKS